MTRYHNCVTCGLTIDTRTDNYARCEKKGFQCYWCFTGTYEPDEPDSGRYAITCCLIGIVVGLVGLAVWWGR